MEIYLIIKQLVDIYLQQTVTRV